MNISVIGAGLMGRPMAEKLIQAGYALTIYNRTIEKTIPLEAQGAVVAPSVSRAVDASECIILMLSDYPAIRDALFHADKEIDFREKTFIQMGTIGPSESVDLEKRINKNQGRYLEAPVLGSIPQIQSGQLIVMVGATEEAYNQWKIILDIFGSNPIYIGAVGQAAALKLALNQLIASGTAAFALSLGMVQHHHIDTDLFMNILRDSAIYAPTYDKKLSRYLAREFENPNFPTRHLYKDVHLIIEEARKCDLNADALEGVSHVIQAALQQGWTDTDYSSIYQAIVPEMKKPSTTEGGL